MVEGEEVVEEEEDTGPLIKRFSLQTLPFVTDAQRQHGLRHEDYERYRRYCAQRLKRIRKCLKFTQGRRSHVKKVLISDNVKDVRFLHIPLVLAERAWAFFMQLKEESKTDDRKKFHMLSRLKKAYKYAEELKALVGSDGVLCDERTELEVTAYAAWMEATLRLELQSWDAAIEQFINSRLIYERLAEACAEIHRPLYLQRVEEIVANLRYCNFMKGGSDGDIDDLLKLQSDGNLTGAMKQLVEKLERAALEQQTSGGDDAGAKHAIAWSGREASVSNEKLKLCFHRVAEKEKALNDSATEPLESAMTLYDQLYGEYDEAATLISKDLAAAKEEQGDAEEANEPVAELEFLRDYVIFKRMQTSNMRTLRMIADTKVAIKAGEKKPSDIIRLYEITCQNLDAINELEPVQDDVSWLKFSKGREQASKALRCFYLAEAHLSGNRLKQADALYNRAVQLTRASQAELSESSMDTKDLMKELTELLQTVRGKKCVIRGKNFLSTQVKASEGADDDVAAATMLEMENFASGAAVASGKGTLTAFPPNFEAVPCKPLYFDLALNYLDFPSMEERIAKADAEQAGAIGAVTGMLGSAASSAVSGLTSWWGGSN